jgi:hypothetical protein
MAERERQEDTAQVSGAEKRDMRHTASTTLQKAGASGAVLPRCRNCGRLGHVRQDCRQKTVSENGSSPGGRLGPGRKV